MTTTNRFLNRALLFVVGLVLLLAGGVVVVGALLPDVQRSVSTAAQDATDPTTQALTGQPWILWVSAVALLVLILLLVRFIVRQGRGRTSTLVRVSSGSAAGAGSVVVEAKVAEQVLEEALSRDPSIVSVDVTAFEVRRRNVLRVTAHTRRGVSPMRTRRAIDTAVRDWDALLGEETPVVIQIVSGLRDRMSSPARVQ